MFSNIEFKLKTSGLSFIERIIARQISERCATAPGSGGETIRLELAIDPSLREEEFLIADSWQNGVAISGGSARAVLYGAGKFIHSSAFTESGVCPGVWRGRSMPSSPFRGIYLATHFNNYYEAAPVEAVAHYMEDLALWGYNTVVLHYPTWQFRSFEDPASAAWMARFKAILEKAKTCGLMTALVQVPNQGFASTPADLRHVKVPGDKRGNFGVSLCPAKPEARKMLLELYARLFEEFRDISLDFLVLWPYDEGGCACDACWPWGAKGFIEISKDVRSLLRSRLSGCKAILSTWTFENEDDEEPDGEWKGMEESLESDKAWIDFILADGHEGYFPRRLLEKGAPGKLPLLNFPEISMFGMYPWGGYGANPAPAHFQRQWDKAGTILSGGLPYSEGVYEDINKVIFAGFYWEPGKNALESVKEYMAYEFSARHADELTRAVQIFERNHGRGHIGGDSKEAFEIASAAEADMPETIRRLWRWRIFMLRAQIDREIQAHGGRIEGQALKEAFSELAKIYHASDATQASVKPMDI